MATQKKKLFYYTQTSETAKKRTAEIWKHSCKGMEFMGRVSWQRGAHYGEATEVYRYLASKGHVGKLLFKKEPYYRTNNPKIKISEL
tara:strand:- start:230 stop:490 length:261 start_codon:yes stop_codon:yes gene_type:complete